MDASFFFISKDDNLNKAHVQYLEARLYELASNAKRVELDNGNKPNPSTLSEADLADMEAFLAEMLVCFPVLGLSAFESPAVRPVEATVYFVKGRGADARGYETDEGFVVLAGSVVCDTEADSTPAFVAAQRKEMKEVGVISEVQGKWTLTQDFLFTSPSTAASAVLGRNANGRMEWKDDTGRTLKHVQEQKVEQNLPANS